MTDRPGTTLLFSAPGAQPAAQCCIRKLECLEDRTVARLVGYFSVVVGDRGNATSVKLGGNRGVRFSAQHVKLAVAAKREKARARAADLAPIIAELRAAGVVTLQAIADGLNERGIPAARGGQWGITQVVRLLESIDNPFVVAVAA